jgi:hypothetical protein
MVILDLAHHHPALVTHIYEVWFLDAQTEELVVNTIPDALFAQCSVNGHEEVLLDVIVGYSKDSMRTVALVDRVKIIDGKRIVSQFIPCWKLCCEWEDSSASWQKLADLKESHPLQVGEFVFTVQIADEPAFDWWVSWVLKKRNCIISLIKQGST